jgi:hypothetical protein
MCLSCDFGSSRSSLTAVRGIARVTRVSSTSTTSSRDGAYRTERAYGPIRGGGLSSFRRISASVMSATRFMDLRPGFDTSVKALRHDFRRSLYLPLPWASAFPIPAPDGTSQGQKDRNVRTRPLDVDVPRWMLVPRENIDCITISLENFRHAWLSREAMPAARVLSTEARDETSFAACMVMLPEPCLGPGSVRQPFLRCCAPKRFRFSRNRPGRGPAREPRCARRLGRGRPRHRLA